MVVACDKVMKGIGDEKGQAWATCQRTRVANKGNPTLGYIMYRREESWCVIYPSLDFSTLPHMPFAFYDFSFINCLGLKG